VDRILLIEDDPEVAQVVQLCLESKNYMVISTMSGEKGLKWLEGPEKPALVICDIGLPDMNGLDLCKKVKSDMNLRKIPVIMLTGRTDNASGLTAGTDSKANLYLTKPVEFDDLIRAVETLIARHKEEQSLLKGIYIKKINFQNPKS